MLFKIISSIIRHPLVSICSCVATVSCLRFESSNLGMTHAAHSRNSLNSCHLQRIAHIR